MASTAIPRSGIPNRRRRIRHKVRTPAYARLGNSRDTILELNEVLDINEDGVAIQFQAPPAAGKEVDLCLNLADSTGEIYTRGRVIWSEKSGRSGVLFSELPSPSLLRLREWLFLNAMSGISDEPRVTANSWNDIAPQPNPSYSDLLAALAAVQRQVDSLRTDHEAILRLLVSRAQSLLRASASAIALATENPATILCRASSGPGAPPVGTLLHLDSGFSGLCVRTGLMLSCGDTETDPRVNAEQCRALGVRSLLAAPVRVGSKVIGLIEVFSPLPNYFAQQDIAALQRMSDILASASSRSTVGNQPVPQEEIAVSPTPGSVLFGSINTGASESRESPPRPAISLPRSHLIVLISAAATIALALGFVLAPWIQVQIQHHRLRAQTVLASAPLRSNAAAATPDQLSLSELQRRAGSGDAAAQNALGVRYATGDGVKLDEPQAIQWFTKAAEQGDPSAQFRLSSFYWSGRGVSQNISQAYFWAVLARAGGEENSKALAQVLSSHLTRDQVRVIEQQADMWLQQHQSSASNAAH